MLAGVFADGQTQIPEIGGGENGAGGSGLGSQTGILGEGEEGVYPYDTSIPYDFTAVTVPKNDGSTLAGSTNGSAGNAVGTVMQVAAAVKDSVVEIMTTTATYQGITAGAGSGVIIHADGIIVTNHHVIDDASTVRVRLTNGHTYAAYLRGSDEAGDIAILKIQPQETLTVARLGYSGALAVGEDVIAIGNPLGMLGGTVTDGIISALEREVEVDGVTMTLLQTNAAINSGNSGGGLFNLAGELIGVVNAKYAASGVEGLGFAIPVDTAAVSVGHLLEKGYIPGIPALGVTLTEIQVRNNGILMTAPCVYDAGSTALQKDDLIWALDGTTVAVGTGSSVSSLDTLKNVLRANYRVGDTVTLTVYRPNGSTYEQTTVSVMLTEYIPT
ncbi:MAG: trypsin-like peptidase domain-containing protein [Clostridia bacterium]|nr:trypsin-like peptidase domain-containing protein [Clostridia bacterium]